MEKATRAVSLSKLALVHGRAGNMSASGCWLPLRRPDNPPLMNLLEEHLQGVGILLQLTGHGAQLSPNFEHLKGQRIQPIGYRGVVE